ncbi:hypothetical protein GCM10023321_58920 [Pseudonocardia eucalypti]|uniref:Uncharacterized protein n=1 Tax=Pseudonocardia eucalypti TaxID=648755 RepID=A0ABP9QT12_9PSEU|nr:hypothetical protein [Pseudonocardia eucalypti]
MAENLTKRGSPVTPVTERTARAGEDDRVHLVDAAPVDVVDPARLRTRCGMGVLEVFNSPQEVTCIRCASRP